MGTRGAHPADRWRAVAARGCRRDSSGTSAGESKNGADTVSRALLQRSGSLFKKICFVVPSTQIEIGA